MKARVIATGHIVDVELSHYIGDVAWYITKCHASYSENELEFIDEPQDYWNRLELDNSEFDWGHNVKHRTQGDYE